MTPDKGDIGLIGQHSLSDGVIGLFTRSPAHHAFMCVDTIGGIVEATPLGARVVINRYDHIR